MTRLSVIALLVGLVGCIAWQQHLLFFTQPGYFRGLQLWSLGWLVLAAACFCFSSARLRVQGKWLELCQEWSKIAWPSVRETGQAMLLVAIVVGITAVYLGLLDWLWSLIIAAVLHQS